MYEDVRKRTDFTIAVVGGGGFEEMGECGFERVEGAEDVDVHDGFECVCG